MATIVEIDRHYAITVICQSFDGLRIERRDSELVMHQNDSNAGVLRAVDVSGKLVCGSRLQSLDPRASETRHGNQQRKYGEPSMYM